MPNALLQEGQNLLRSGRVREAQMLLAEGVFSSPDHGPLVQCFVNSVSLFSIQVFNPVLKQGVLNLLARRDFFHSQLWPAWFNLVRHPDNPNSIQRFLKNSFLNDDQDLQFSDQDLRRLSDPLFLSGLPLLLMKDYSLEKLLIRLRRFLCFNIGQIESTQYQPLFKALADQSLLNEYLYAYDADEAERFKAFEGLEQPSLEKVYMYAAYTSLFQSPLAEKAKQVDGDTAYDQFLTDHVFNQEEEQRLQENLNAFGVIDTHISKEVQTQYEENPYPRWLFCSATRPDHKKHLSKGKKILIAGCGTGQQAVTVGLNFPDADITAIDLSRASLAYAMRKTQDYGVQNVRFLHGDLVQVSAIGELFDYIISGGVLHHLEKPEEGLAALCAVLKEDGVLRLAVYSRIARRDIIPVQHWIKEHGFEPTLYGIRAFRAAFHDRGPTELFDGRAIPYDGFCTSEVRDLFFNVQERCYTCPELAEWIGGQDLSLIVFAPEAQKLHMAYKQRFPDDPQAVNLNNWHALEQEFPNAFITMYKFFACKNKSHPPGTLPDWLA